MRPDAADSNNDGRLDIADGAFLLRYLFLDDQFAPHAPGPPHFPCGPDTERPGAEGNLGCEEYQACPGRGVP